MGLVSGKVAIVTGAGANIGEACAKMLAAQGASVVIADINVAGATRVAEEITAAGGKALAHAVDLADEASIIALIAATIGFLNVIRRVWSAKKSVQNSLASCSS